MKIGICGGAGRMGQMLIRQVRKTKGVDLVGVLERSGSPLIGQDAGVQAGIGHIGVAMTGDPALVFAAADVVIDFTAPVATASHAVLAGVHKTALVIGTTGIGPNEQFSIDSAAHQTVIVQAPNMAVGVVLLSAAIEQVARTLDTDFDIEIVEMHHRHKVDAPSGTALYLGEAAARGRGVNLAEQSVRSRDGHTGARPEGTIGFATLRGGDVIGEHTAIFAGEGERVELTHKASSRDIFAAGAVRAALWTKGKAPGKYSMRDVLGI
ncbi:4-hydroxy-tetrahydrodipicolinate reductase [Lacibacterium aquatile]|uniref:4-hydroxy-tetrahydrodipicolinate reductase n=1 Tax=Lacibacterium aquatile TaxID=1168082 RepID=A0ABW5DMC1_9PROT